MPDKSFSFYAENQNNDAESNLLLLVEIARSHVVCIASGKADKLISAFELFTYKEAESGDIEKVFKFVLLNSAILSKSFSATEVFINNEFGLPVPQQKFNKEIAAEYANIAFGENPFSATYFEQIGADTEIINVFRIPESIYTFCQSQFPDAAFKHTWSNIIYSISAKTASFPSEYLIVQFYNSSIILAVVKNSKLHFIQFFVYQNPDDVLYYLLNICSHFGFDFETLPIHISGMIDLNFNLYRELIRYFKHVFLQNVDESNLLIDVKEFPLHYFTPFFNLAL